MKKAHVVVSGFVQGVGFRHFVKKEAIKLNLKGWVKNLPGGEVEAVFAGNKENIEEMIELCKNGPFLSEVKDVKILWEEVDEEFSSFDIIT